MITSTITGTGISVNTSWYGDCKYRLPCGYCELKKKDCDWWQTLSVPCGEPIKVTPNWNEVTCSTERSEG